MSARRPTPLPRGRRSGVATVAALVLLAACVLGAVAALQIRTHHAGTALGRPAAVASWLRGHHWGDGVVLVTAVVVGIVGLLLLMAGLLPARRTLLRIGDLDDTTVAGIGPHALVRDLTAVVAHVDGVASASVRIRRSQVRVQATPALRDTTGLADSVRGAVQDRIGSVDPAVALTVRVEVKEPTA